MGARIRRTALLLWVLLSAMSCDHRSRLSGLMRRAIRPATEKIDQLLYSQDVSAPDLGMVIEAAESVARNASAIPDAPPPGNRHRMEEYRRFAGQLQENALGLANAAREGDLDKTRERFITMKQSCIQCHQVFKPPEP